MRYLLDTHTLLWILQSPGKLAATVRRIVEDPASTLMLSIATPWEMAVKTNAGKLDAHNILRDFERLAHSGYASLETKVSHVTSAGFLPLHHRDPFDRLIVAQALELDIPVLSRDKVFDLYGVKRIWD
jgi:PIN domain nuclease of toxin-antitoxin system